MADDFEEDIVFDAADDMDGEAALIVDIDGYEGPLHLLLDLARKQKVDLAKISILELAEQYITFIQEAKSLRIELAADYLVMASWLAYLKSRLILPKTEFVEEAIEADELAAHLAFRLQRLEGMRRAASGLFRLPMVGQSVFIRGMPEGLRSKTTPLYTAELYDVIKAYGEIRSKSAIRRVQFKAPKVLALEEARRRLQRVIGHNVDWVSLASLLPESADLGGDPPPVESVLASSLMAGLELAKEGKLEIRQDGTFAPIYLRHKPETDEVT